ncbi:hypothetical protein KCU83_g616, partial [Aureobasidium melanogenum]
MRLCLSSRNCRRDSKRLSRQRMVVLLLASSSNYYLLSSCTDGVGRVFYVVRGVGSCLQRMSLRSRSVEAVDRDG